MPTPAEIERLMPRGVRQHLQQDGAPKKVNNFPNTIQDWMQGYGLLRENKRDPGCLTMTPLGLDLYRRANKRMRLIGTGKAS